MCTRLKQLTVFLILLITQSELYASGGNLLSEQNAKNTQLFYFNLSKNVVGKTAVEFFKPYLAYCDSNGVYKDKMMDAMLFLDLSYNNYGKYNLQEWNYYLNNVFKRTKLPVLQEESSTAGPLKYAIITNNLAAGLSYELETNKPGTYSLTFDYKTINITENTSELMQDLIIAVEYLDLNGNKVYPAESDLIYSSGLDLYFKYVNINEKDTNNWKNISTTFFLNAQFSKVRIKVLNWGLANFYKLAIDNFSVKYGSQQLISETDRTFEYDELQTKWEYVFNNRMNYLYNDRNALIDELNKANHELKNEGVLVGNTKLILEIPDFSAYVNTNNPALTQEIKDNLDNYITSIHTSYTAWLTKTPNASVDLIGVYHLDENISKSEEVFYVDVFNHLREKLKSYNWKLFSSPYNGFYSCNINSSYTDNALSVFDLSWQQPNAFHSGRYGNIDPDMLIKANDLASTKNIAINIENRYIASNEWYGRLNDYIDYGEKYGYINYSKVFYDDGGGHYLHSKSKDKTIRANYDNLYRFIRQANQGQLINGDFETLDIADKSKFHFWSGNYAIKKHRNQYVRNRKFNFITSNEGKIPSGRINLKGGEEYSLTFMAKERIDDGVDFSALIGVCFYDSKHQQITIVDKVNLPFSTTLNSHYRYLRTSDTFTFHEVKFRAPDNAVYASFFLKKLGESVVEWESLKLRNSSAIAPPTLFYESNDSLQFESIPGIGCKSLLLNENNYVISKERIPVQQGKAYSILISAVESMSFQELISGNKALIGVEMYDINGVKLDIQPPLDGFNYSTVLKMNYFYLSSINQNWKQFSKNVQFPDNTYSIKVYIRNWYHPNTLLFDNLSLKLKENEGYDFDRTIEEHNLIKKSQWNDLFPLTIDNSKSVRYNSYIDVSRFKILNFSALIKGRDVKHTLGDYLVIEFFDDHYNFITQHDASIALAYSEEFSYWYKKVFEHSSVNCSDYYTSDTDRNLVPNWYTNQWVKDSFDIEIPLKAQFMRIAFVRQPIEGEFKILNPVLFPKILRSGIETSVISTLELSQYTTPFYPNPVTDFMYLPFKDDNENMKIIITCLNGKQQLKKDISNSQVDLSFLPSGLYLMQLLSSTNDKMFTFFKQ